MYIEDDTVGRTVASLAAVACTELFSAYGVELAATSEPWEQVEEPLLSAVMGFVGQKLRGTCLLACAQATTMAACPTNGRARDWIGELANQLVGRLKSKLLMRDIDVALSTPIAIKGLRLEPLPRRQLEPSVFSSSQGQVMVWVEVEVASDFKLLSEGPSRARGEGEVILF
jgi:CheY-specific phosphatase CheX